MLTFHNNKQFVTFSFFWPLGNYIASSKLNVRRRKGHIFLRFSKSTFSCDLQKVHRKINFIKDFCNCKKIKGFIFYNMCPRSFDPFDIVQYCLKYQYLPLNLECFQLACYMSKKCWPILYCKLLYKMGQDILDIQ